MRGGISMVSKRHAKANNLLLRSNPLCSTEYNPDKENNNIKYYDANNFYGWAMSQPLPYSDFKWLSVKVGKRQKGKVWILEVDLENILKNFLRNTTVILLHPKTINKRKMALALSDRTVGKQKLDKHIKTCSKPHGQEKICGVLQKPPTLLILRYETQKSTQDIGIQ